MKHIDQLQINDFIKSEIAYGHIPGAVLYIAHQGDTILKEAYGNRLVKPYEDPMRLDTIFDLASLTKVIATLPAALKLLEQGKLALSDPIQIFLPEVGSYDGESIRILHLLSHTSGLAADLMSREAVMHMSREELLEHVLRAKPHCRPGTKVVYSDLGMILLYRIIEIVTGEPFDSFLKREIFDPLEMYHTCFRPTFEESRYAATEFSNERNAYKIGVVHDEKAERMGGVSGHAGLFSTIDDLANFSSMIAGSGIFKGNKILSKAAIDLSRRNFTPYDIGEYRGLGWVLKNPISISSGGDFLSSSSFGHTGFTGTSIWFDPEIDLQIILLTNRVHFGRTDHILRFRPRLHNLIRSLF
ncbi:CubicO group peptidase, beta-lactamase class C family [Paenibacillus sp. yr247]|uniref:serine hydrolase domain-containing protein n=1 Tax=Paenibacillus sp. yr247 TaxID=1761880 RepID=UPI00088A982F|nr:serine hydrolase domain-containing protein [Paenibacillus sp. yr247]SDN94091.1 CubicO group peptidase, beta-lactamase class C family [Paenibacillus sp. yr247]